MKRLQASVETKRQSWTTPGGLRVRQDAFGIRSPQAGSRTVRNFGACGGGPLYRLDSARQWPLLRKLRRRKRCGGACRSGTPSAVPGEAPPSLLGRLRRGRLEPRSRRGPMGCLLSRRPRQLVARSRLQGVQLHGQRAGAVRAGRHLAGANGGVGD